MDLEKEDLIKKIDNCLENAENLKLKIQTDIKMLQNNIKYNKQTIRMYSMYI